MEHYYSESPVSGLRMRKISARLRGMQLEFYTGSGVFSLRKIDRGTEILVNHAMLRPGQRILDLGCGYGAAGIAAAKAFPSSSVVMTDINRRAVELAKKNAGLHNLKNTLILQGNIFQNVKGKFDTILLNPPQNAGRKICNAMIEQSRDFLEKGGMLQLVARRNKGGDVLGRKMDEVFGNMEVIAKKSGYWLYLSRKR
jgi:16S rRNA (guanine1207-N2)-methyltransferase